MVIHQDSFDYFSSGKANLHRLKDAGTSHSPRGDAM